MPRVPTGIIPVATQPPQAATRLRIRLFFQIRGQRMRHFVTAAIVFAGVIDAACVSHQPVISRLSKDQFSRNHFYNLVAFGPADYAGTARAAIPVVLMEQSFEQAMRHGRWPPPRILSAPGITSLPSLRRPLNPRCVHRRLHAVVVMKQLALFGFCKSSAIHQSLLHLNPVAEMRCPAGGYGGN
jgi:hypothetical protein